MALRQNACPPLIRSTATVHNSVAYRALGLNFELWSSASSEVVTIYLQHFDALLSVSRHAHYNTLRTFQKSAIVKRMLFALRSGFFDTHAVEKVVNTLCLVLRSRWSADDAIKPTFSFLVTGLCQINPTHTLMSPTEAPPSLVPASLVLTGMAELVKDPARLIKLNRSIALHRLLIIFISSNTAYYVVIPCLQILKLCFTTPGLESFQRSFENEGGFTLLARSLGPIWRADIQSLVFGSLYDPEQDKGAMICSGMVPVVTAAIETLLSTAMDSDDSSRPAHGRTRSGTVTSIRSISITALPSGELPFIYDFSFSNAAGLTDKQAMRP